MCVWRDYAKLANLQASRRLLTPVRRGLPAVTVTHTLQSQSTESKGGAIVRGRALFLWQRVHTLALTRLTARASSHVPSYTSSKSSLVSSCPDDGETRQAHIAIITGRRTKLHGNILMGIGESVI